jgi:multidrug resistance efflux pump
LSGTISLLIGGFILATFLALFNYLTPSGRVTVTGRVVEVTPNVTGQIVAIPVKPNVPVKANDVLFQIDPAPFQYKVTQLQASLAAAKQQVEILKSNYEQATANVSGLTTQVAYNKKRLADIETLAADMANTEFQAQDKQVQYETVSAQLGAPRLRSRAPNSRSIPRSAVSTRQSRSSRHSSITPTGSWRRPPFAHPLTAMSPSLH